MLNQSLLSANTNKTFDPWSMTTNNQEKNGLITLICNVVRLI